MRTMQEKLVFLFFHIRLLKQNFNFQDYFKCLFEFIHTEYPFLEG